MKLYLVQHGQAMSKEENPDRPLTDNGRSDVEKVADFLKNAGTNVEKIIHSGKTRAEQTAAIIASKLNPTSGVIQEEGLTPNDPVGVMIKELQETYKDIIIVGHLPYLGKLASSLLTNSESANVVMFQQGGCLCLERTEEGTWHIAWIIVPSILS